MRTAALAHFLIFASALGGPVLAQNQPAPDLSPPEVQTAPDQSAPRILSVPDQSAPRILSVPDAPTSSITQQPAEQTAPVAQQPPEPAPKVQDRADTKGDFLPPPPPESRFSFRRVDGGFVRLDNRSGQIAHCGPRDARWSCQTAAPEGGAPADRELTELRGGVSGLKVDMTGLKDEVTGLKNEVTGLKGEVSGLKGEVSALNEQIAALTREVEALRPPPPAPPAPVPDNTQDETLKMPTREDVARARDYVREKAQATWQRLVDMIGDVRKDVLGSI